MNHYLSAGWVEEVSEIGELFENLERDFLDKKINQPRLFRGTSNVSYPLEPSLFRALPPRENKPDNLDWAATEYISLHRFVQTYFNSSYSDLPGSRETLLSIYRSKKIPDHLETWPQEEYLPLLSLMQHLGLPTRLLDWTLRPEISVLFACVGYINSYNGKNHHNISVWSMSSTISKEKFERGQKVTLVEPSPQDNENLMRQQGRFTFFTPQFYEKGSSNLDMLVTQKYKTTNTKDGRSLLKCYSFPGEKVKGLYDYLGDHYDLHEGKIYSSIEGAKRRVLTESNLYRYF